MALKMIPQIPNATCLSLPYLQISPLRTWPVLLKLLQQSQRQPTSVTPVKPLDPNLSSLVTILPMTLSNPTARTRGMSSWRPASGTTGGEFALLASAS